MAFQLDIGIRRVRLVGASPSKRNKWSVIFTPGGRGSDEPYAVYACKECAKMRLLPITVRGMCNKIMTLVLLPAVMFCFLFKF